MTPSRSGFFYCAPFRHLFLALILLLPSLSRAQQVTRWEIFGGYSYMRFDSQSIGFRNQSNLNGAELSGLFNISRKWAVTAGASGNLGNEFRVYNFMAGPQYSYRMKKGTVFVRGLFGKCRDQVSAAGGKTSIGKVFGGGIGYDWQYTPRFNIRVLQVDYLNGDTYGATQKNVRVSAGIVYRFGGK